MPGKAFRGECEGNVPPVREDAADEATVSVNALARDRDPLPEDERAGKAGGHTAEGLTALGTVDAFETNPNGLVSASRYVERIAVHDVAHDANDRRWNRRRSTKGMEPVGGLSDCADWPRASEHEDKAAQAP